MNKSHVTGGIDKAVGKVKEAVGNAINNQKLANEGAAQQVCGEARETWGNVKDSAAELHKTVRAKADDVKVRTRDDQQTMRDKVTSTATRVKEDIAGKLDQLNKKQEAKRDDMRKAS
jgi:uncharacterized protein YjbJ (UPF0337 family)